MEDLKDRTRNYALRIIKLYGALPARGVGQILANQIVRSGTSVGAHYREAIRSRSPAAVETRNRKPETRRVRRSTG